MLTHNQTESTPPTMPMNAEESQIIHSRFGEIVVDSNRAFRVPRGLLGMPGRVNFTVAEFPLTNMAEFKLLQSLDDEKLSFIVLPIELENTIIRKQDLELATKDMRISAESTEILLVVSVHRMPGQVRLSVNARAPIIIDRTRNLGHQYVYQHDAYKVQHYISM